MIEKIYLYNFRNIKNTTLMTKAKNVVLVGNNGQGKTNILEAIYISAIGSSFRESKIEKTISLGKDEMSVISYNTATTKTTFNYIKDKKIIKINDSKISDRKDLLKHNPCIVFSYNDIDITIIQDKRRKFFDQLFSFIDDGYINLLREHKSIMKHKVIALKDSNIELIKSMNKLLSANYLLVKNIKKILVSEFLKLLNDEQEKIWMKKIDINLDFSIKQNSEQDIYDYLNSKIDSEIKHRVCLYNINRDRYLFTENSINIEDIFSIGQKRLFTIILKTNSSNIMYKYMFKKPILLLDDIFLELDEIMQNKVLGILPDYEQAFFTFLPNNNLSKNILNSLVFNVENGKVSYT